MRHRELAHEVGHVAHARAAKAVDALVVVAHRHHRTTGHGVSVVIKRCRIVALPGQHLDPGVLQPVGVLELVDQDVAKAPLVMFPDRCVVTQQFVAAQHQFAKIHHAFALALFFVQRVNFDLLAPLQIVLIDRHILGAQAVFLAGGNEASQVFGWKALVIDFELLAQPLDG